LLAACGHRSLDEIDEVYARWDGNPVLCAANLDTVSGNDVDSIERGMDRAAADGTVLLLYTHVPGVTVPIDKIEAVVAYADSIHLPALTYHDLANGPPRAGYSLAFDDSRIDEWYSIKDMLASHHAVATYFVTRYDRFNVKSKQELRELADAGGDVEAHSVNHLRAPDYVELNGLDAYLDDEAFPSIDRLVADGYTPIAYAYPFGAHTRELDDALLARVQLVRSVSFTGDDPLIESPCRN
jgi:hypothetical protein